MEMTKIDQLYVIADELRATATLGLRFDTDVYWPSRTKVHLFHFIFLMNVENPNPSTSEEASEVGARNIVGSPSA